MGSIQNVGPSPESPAWGDGWRLRAPSPCEEPRRPTAVMCGNAQPWALRHGDAPRGSRNGAIAWGEVQRDALEHGPGPLPVPDRRDQPWAPRLLQFQHRHDARRDGPALDRWPRQSTFQWFLPNPWVTAPFVSASPWSEGVVVASASPAFSRRAAVRTIWMAGLSGGGASDFRGRAR